ncbi:MAG: carbohydrate kinase family protein [Candidatus Bathyarchaeota archaeon]
MFWCIKPRSPLPGREIAGKGEESFILDLEESPGGSAANTAVGLARLKVKTGFIGKVASDREGEILLQSFRNENVDINGVIISNKGRSGVVTGYVDKTGERTLYVDPGVNDSLEFQEIARDYIRSAKFLHLTSFVGKKPFEAQKKLLENTRNVKISFDPGEIYVRKGLTALRPLLKKSYVIFPNENEVKLLTKENHEKGSKFLIKEGVGLVAVKLGAKGCYVTDGHESYLIKPYKVRAVDSTGAGDAFCAGFLYGLSEHKDLYECGKLGNFVASRCIEKVGAREGCPYLSKLNAEKIV